MKARLLLFMICISQITTFAQDCCSGMEAWFKITKNGESPQVEFTNQSVGSIDYILWKFGDGEQSTDEHVAHTYGENGSYQVCLVIENNNGCRSEFCRNLVIGELEHPCEGAWADFGVQVEGNTMNTLNYSKGNGSIYYSWNFGDGNTSTSFEPNHSFAEVGIYNVCLVTQDSLGCSGKTCRKVCIDAVDPCAQFEVNFEYEGTTNPYGFVFQANASPEWDFIVWDFGDGTTETGASYVDHAFPGPGTYEVCVVIESNEGCRAEYCTNIVIEGEEGPCEGFEVIFGYQGTSNPRGFIFRAETFGAYDYIIWNFGDGATETGPEIADHLYDTDGIYEVCVVIESNTGCRAEYCTEIVVGNASEMEMDYIYVSELQLQFVAQTTTPYTDISWDFDDGNSSSALAPQHTYEAPGNYTVCYTLDGTNTKCTPIEVTTARLVPLKQPSLNIPNPISEEELNQLLEQETDWVLFNLAGQQIHSIRGERVVIVANLYCASQKLILK